MNLENIIDSLSENAKVENEADYIDAEGLLCCGMCHTRKQVQVSFAGVDKTVNCICQCEKERRDAHAATLKAEEAQRQRDRNRAAGFPESQYREWTFANDDRRNPKNSDMMLRYAERFNANSGMGLLLTGDRGTGKTYLSACVANHLIDNGYKVLMTNMSRISNVVNATFEQRQAELDRILSVDLLVIDDLGTERGTDYMLEQVFNVVDGRYKANKPMVISTNLTLQEMHGETGLALGRIYDRIIEKCYPIEFKGQNRRRAMSFETMKQGRELLEG